ncbi:hypothetical protein N0V90_003980 [Kalmusia sp. IMI 367209]|nr:hypothetical protein N0V90_003980 [Kalmusia sp. IMI 367209]
MASTSRDFHLSILDQTMLRMYVRHLLIFEFPDPGHLEDAVDALRAGLSATIRQFPILAGTIKPSDAQTGRLSLQYPEIVSEELIDQIFTFSFDQAGNPNFEYTKMEKAGFPPSSLPRDAFCPDLLRSHPGLDDAFAEGMISFEKGQPVPVMAVRATFTRGGLILSVYSHHSAIDGSGIAKIYKAWSGYTKSYAQTGTLKTSLESKHEVGLDAQRHSFDDLAISNESIDCPEVRYPGTPSRTTSLRAVPYKLSAKIFVFSASTISELASELSSITKKRVSSFNALVSLLWTQVTVARSSILAKKNIESTSLSIAYDHRKNLDEHFKESYLGNCATGIKASVPVSSNSQFSTSVPKRVRDLLSTESSVNDGISFSNMLFQNPEDSIDAEMLAPTALVVADTLSSITLDWLKARLSLFTRTPDSHRLSMDVDIVNGPDLFVTSWMRIGTDCTWGIPGTTSSLPKAIRKPQSSVEGNIHILPTVREENEAPAFEVLMCLEEWEMEKVMRRLEGERWAIRVISA